MIKVALAQINPIVGDLRHNSAKIISYINKAKTEGADLVVFPELALTGYPPEDLLLKKYFILEVKRSLDSIRKKAGSITALIGFVDKQGGSIYNSCAIIQDRKIKGVYHKMALPNYGVFDEKRYFSEGDVLYLCDLGSYRFAVTICEDVWTEDFPLFLKGKGLDFIINISASPFHSGKISQRQKVLSRVAKLTKSFLFYCNMVGGQDEIVFDGTSKVFSRQGKLIACANRFGEQLFTFTLNKKKKYTAKKVIVKEEEEVFLALRLGLYDYVKKNGFKKIVIGVSGGIDSALVAALAKIALGKDNVFGLIMPSCYTSSATFSDARRICNNLGIKYKVLSIDDILQSYTKKLDRHLGAKLAGKTQENLQARIRGNILMAFSNKFGYLVLNTGNKSEVSCGYCTLYGDMVGGFGVLRDVPKLLVYRLANYINKISKNEVIPYSVIKRAPSAELKKNQKDTDTLPPYKLLDPILKLYIQDECSLEEIVKRGFKKALVKKIISMVDSNEYKRRQAPVGIKITPRAFGKDRRMPITNKFSQ